MELGDKLKAIRLRHGMTLAQLAGCAGVSKSMLSRIERNDSAPTVTTLSKIADALGIEIASIFSTLDTASAVVPTGGGSQAAAADRSADGDAPASGVVPTDVAIVRAHQRKRVILPWGADYEMLCPDLRRRIEFIHINYPVGGGSGELYSHEGEECGFVLQGRFRGIVGDQEFVLEAGDSVSYASSIPHRWENAGDVDAKAIWAVTPPSFLTGKLASE